MHNQEYIENQQYVDTQIKPIMEPIIFQLVCERPEDPIKFIIDWLKKTGGYTENGLTIKEKEELERLRIEIDRFKSLDTNLYRRLNQDSNDVRDKLKTGKTRKGVSAEAYGKFNVKENFQPRIIPKNPDQMDRIKSKIIESVIFRSLEHKDLHVVIQAMEEKKYIPGDVVIKQGEQGDCLFVVEEGELECFRISNDFEEKVILKNYYPGDSFGEIALLYNSPRAATVVAKTHLTLWALDRDTFNHIVKDAAKNKRETYETFLKSIEIFKYLSPYEVGQVCDSLRTCSFQRGEYIVKEGEEGEAFYIVEEGEAIVQRENAKSGKKEPAVNYKRGDYFGELSLLLGLPRAASVKARTNIKLIYLDKKSFRRLLGPIENIMKKRALQYQK